MLTATLLLALAAEQAPALDTQPRTGAGRAQPEAPAFPDRAMPAPPFAPPQPAPAADTPPVDGGTITAGRVEIAVDPAPRPRALRAWKPDPPGADGLALAHRKGELLDAAWVARQFDVNGIVGVETGFDRVWTLVQMINAAYVANGYINSGVLIEGLPRAAGEPLSLRLVYGRLVPTAEAPRGIAVQYRRHRLGLGRAFVSHRLPSAREVPLNIKNIERDFRLLADNPAVRTVAIDLRPGTRPGAATLDVTLDPQPRGDVFVTWGSSRSPSVGGRRLAVGGMFRNLLTSGDIFSAESGTTSGLKDASGSYQTPFLSPTSALFVRGGANRAVVVDAPLRPLDIRSREWYAEGGVSGEMLARPLTPIGPDRWSAAQSLRFGLLVSHRQVKSYLLGEPFSFSPGSVNGRTEYTALRATADYLRRSPSTVLAFSATVSRGLSGTQTTVKGLPSVSTHFTTVLAQANFAHRLNATLTELRLRLAGQWARGRLYSPERFSVGGRDTVRGYRENLLLADEGVVGSVELAQPVHLLGSDPRIGRNRLATFTLSAFVDGALVRNTSAPQPLKRRIASVGVGLGWSPADWLSADASYARGVPRVESPGSCDLQDRGFAFRIVLHPLAFFRR